MPNDTGGFSSGFGLRGGSIEQKRVGASTEIKIPLAQGILIWLVNWIGLFVGYLILKSFIWTRGDWSLLIGILSIVLLVTFLLWSWKNIHGYIVWLHVFRLCFKAWEWFDDSFQDWRARYLNWVVAVGRGLAIVIFLFPVIAIGAIVLLFYVAVIVPQTIVTLNEQAQYVALVCAGFAFPQARKATVKFFITALTDTLRDSDQNYARELIKLEWEKEKYYREHPQIEAQRPDMAQFVPKLESKPRLTDSEKHYYNLRDFLMMLIDRKLPMTKNKWAKTRMPTTGDELGRGKLEKLRDELLSSGYLEWVDETDVNKGVQFNPEYTMEQLKDMISREGFATGSSRRVG